MQFGRRANSTARAKSFVNKTKDAFGSIIKSFKSLDFIPSYPSSAFRRVPASTEDDDDDDDLPYPSPPFARAYTAASQRSGSTGSTAVASISSRYTYRTNTTAAEDNCLNDVIVRKSTPQSLAVNKKGKASFSIEPESDEDYLSQESDGEGDEDDEVLLIRSNRGGATRTGFATSLPHNPYAAFLSQPLYKQPYVFPRRS